MKRKPMWLALVTVLLLLLLAACQGSAVTNTPAPEEVATEPAGETEPVEQVEPTEAPEVVEEEPAEEVAEEGACEEPIRIGFMTPFSSTSAESAQDMADAWDLFWEQHGTEVAGCQIELFIEDTEGNPDVALNKALLLVEQRNVDMLVGTLFANVGLAVAEYVKDNGVPLFLPVASADDLTQRNRIPNVIRVAGWTSSAPHHVFGDWVANNSDCRQVYTIASDYAFGHEVTGGFINTFTDNGGEVVDQAWNPIAEADFSSYMASVLDAEPDCVFAIQVGAAAVRLHQAWSDFGLEGQIPLYLGEVMTDQSILRGVDPPEIAIGKISVGHYAEGRDAAATQEFVEAFDAAYGKLPSYYAVASYTAGLWIAEALEQVGGNVQDRDAFLEAIRNVTFEDTPVGPLRLDEYGNPVQDMYIREVVQREDGRLWNIVIDTIPNVSQFWTYDPDEFLQQPVYSRDYQGVDWP